MAALRWESRPLQVLGSCGEASGSLLASRRGLCDAPVGLGAAEQRGSGGAGSSALLCAWRAAAARVVGGASAWDGRQGIRGAV